MVAENRVAEDRVAQGWQKHHTVWLMLFLGWTFSYLDRALTGPVVTWMIANKVGFLQAAAKPYALGGLLGSLFFAGYMLTQFPGGYFGDKFGYRTIIVISLFWAGVATLLTGLTGGLVAFVAFRVLTGLGEGVLYSNDRSLVSQVTPPRQLGLGMGVVMGGLTLGLTIALLGTIHVIGLARPALGANAWKAPFMILGAATIGVAFLMKRYLAPATPGVTYPYGRALASLLKYSAIFFFAIMGVYFVTQWMGLSDVAIAVILTGLALLLVAFIYSKKAKEVRPILRDRNLMLIYLSAIAVLWHLWFYGYWSVAIVKDFGGGAFATAALVASFNAVAGLLGFPLGGKLSDLVAHRPNGRRNVLALLTAGLTVLIFVFGAYLMTGRKDPVTLSAILFVSGLLFFALQAVSHALTAESAPDALRGSAFGMWNLIAEIGAVLSPVVSGALRDATGSWGAPILLDGALMGVSCGLVLLVTSAVHTPAPAAMTAMAPGTAR
jgi:MFS family permease